MKIYLPAGGNYESEIQDKFTGIVFYDGIDVFDSGFGSRGHG